MSNARGKPAVRVPRIALTGGIASGKSTVAKLFTTLGAKLIDTDQIARDIVAPPSVVLDRIVARFGPEVLQADGALDRTRLRRVVFSDPDARRDLEAITHPVIHEEVERLAREAGGPYLLVAVPLLVETGTQGAVRQGSVDRRQPGDPEAAAHAARWRGPGCCRSHACGTGQSRGAPRRCPRCHPQRWRPRAARRAGGGAASTLSGARVAMCRRMKTLTFAMCLCKIAGCRTNPSSQSAPRKP